MSYRKKNYIFKGRLNIKLSVCYVKNCFVKKMLPKEECEKTKNINIKILIVGPSFFGETYLKAKKVKHVFNKDYLKILIT